MRGIVATVDYTCALNVL